MTTHNNVPNEIICGISHNWGKLTPHERAEQVRDAADECGVTASTVYRQIKGYRECGRLTGGKRADKGSPRSIGKEKMEHYIKQIMGLKSLDPTKPDNRIANPNKSMSTARAIEILVKMGRIPQRIITPRTANRWARIYRATVKHICAPTPAVKLVSEHPNHVHVIDFSVCEQYYLREKNGKIAVMPWAYKNKPNESKKKIWAFAMVDHYSTVKFIKYFLSPGESSSILYRGLMEAWKTKDDSQFPFHGAPRYLYADKGSALRSERIQNLLTALGVEVLYHKPGNPRAKGMVESTFRHMQVDFESELRLCPAQTIDELNERVYNWVLAHNWKIKQGEQKPRFNKWQEITREQLLEMPPNEILNKVTAFHKARTVDAYCTVSVYNKKFGVPEVLSGKKVRVWHTIDNGVAVQDIETGEVYQNVEQKKAVFGVYNAHKKSAAERMQDEAIRIAQELKADITPEVLRRDVPNLYAMPSAGTPITVDSELVCEEEAEWGSVYQAKRAIAEELRMNLSDLPEWMLAEIESALRKVNLNKKKVNEIARYVEGFLREARSAV